MNPSIDDPVYDAVLRGKLVPYIKAAKEWWAHKADVVTTESGSFALEGPPGWTMKIARIPQHSPIKGVQAFPFVGTPALQLTHAAGGVRHMVQRVIGNGITIDGIVCLVRMNLTSTNQAGQFIAFVPEDELRNAPSGRWIYFTPEEMMELTTGFLSGETRRRVMVILAQDRLAVQKKLGLGGP